MRNSTKWILITAVLVLAAMPALSQEGDVPTARQVVDRYIEAMGGEEAIRANNTMVMEGNMEMVGQGMSADIQVKAMAPDKMKMEMTIPGMGSIQSGFDGEVGWAMNPMTGPMLLEGKELSQAVRQADFYSVLHGENLYSAMTNTGSVEFEGSPCWKVELTTHDGDTITEYYNHFVCLLAHTTIEGDTNCNRQQMTERSRIKFNARNITIWMPIKIIMIFQVIF